MNFEGSRLPVIRLALQSWNKNKNTKTLQKNRLKGFLYLILFFLSCYMNTRGCSNWSLPNLNSLDMGGPLKHGVYTMNVDGSNLIKFMGGNNSQGASFPPDGQWIAFTACAN